MNRAKDYELLTFQTLGHDITLRHEPLPEYTEDYGPYSELRKYLKWEQWLWAFQSLADFKNEYFVYDYLTNKETALWRLRIPAEKIRWCGLLRQCQNERPVHEWFFQNPQSCRTAVDIPQGFVKVPISSTWVVQKS